MVFIKSIIPSIKEDIWAYSLLALGFLLRLVYIFNFTKPESYLWSDPGYYDFRALQVAKDEFTMFSTYWPPFFHLFLSLIYRPLIWLGVEDWRIKIDVILFAAFYIIGFWCIYQIAKKLFNKKIALIILAILIFWYPLIFLNYVVMSENLFFPLVFFGLYLLIVKPLKPITGVWLGILWGTALLARPVFALVLPFFVLWGLYYKIGWRLILNFIITAWLILGAMMAFNFYYTSGAEKSISSNGGVGFAMLWCDAKSISFSSNGYYFGFGPPANGDHSIDTAILTTVPFENQKFYYQMGIDCFKKHPMQIFENFSSIRKLFNSTLFPTTSDITGWQTLRLIFKTLTGFLFLGSFLTIIGIFSQQIKVNKEDKKYFYFMGLIIFSLLFTVFVQNVGEERYIIPYAPLLIILSVPIINWILVFSKVKKAGRLP